MAKLPRTGVAYQCLYEQEHSLSEVMASLGLKPLSTKAARGLRERLGFALGKREEPCAGVEVDDVAQLIDVDTPKVLRKSLDLQLWQRAG